MNRTATASCLASALLGAAVTLLWLHPFAAPSTADTARRGVAQTPAGRPAPDAASSARSIDDGAMAEVPDELDPRDPARSILLVTLAERDPSVALQQALKIDAMGLRELTAERVARAWARTDPVAAVSALRNMREVEPPLRHFMHGDAVDEWARFDPEAALDYLMSTEGRQLFDLNWGGPGSILMQIAERRPELVRAAADRVRDGQLKGLLQRAAQQAQAVAAP